MPDIELESRIPEDEQLERLRSLGLVSYETRLVGHGIETSRIADNVANVTGYSPEDFAQRPDLLLTIVHPDDYRALIEHIIISGQGDGTHITQYRIKPKVEDGEELVATEKDKDGYLWVQDVAKLISKSDEPAVISGVLQDITSLKLTQLADQELLLYMAEHDVLTGLVNRRKFTSILEEELALAIRGENDLAVFFIDLDRFKTYNDTHGHHVGDQLLQALSKLIVTGRETDTAARLGGDEFALLLPFTDNDGAKKLALALSKKIREAAIHTDVGPLSLTCSIGIYCINTNHDKNPDASEAVLKRADMAMYRAKQHGGNRVAQFNPDSADESKIDIITSEGM